MKILAVYHQQNGDWSSEEVRLAANAGLSINGAKDTLTVIPKLKEHGSITAMYSSRMARAVDTASFISLELDLDYATLPELAPYSAFTGGNLVRYPGYPETRHSESQGKVLERLKNLYVDHANETIILVSHKTIIGMLLSAVEGVLGDDKKILEFAMDADNYMQQVIAFEYNGQKLTKL